MFKLFARLKWIFQGRPTVRYRGYCCGCCGKWVEEEFCLPTYQALDEWFDTWGLCSKCKEGG